MAAPLAACLALLPLNFFEEMTMATRISRITFAALAMITTTVALGRPPAADDQGIWKSVLSDAEFAKLVAADAKIIADTLKKGEPDKKGVGKIRAAAMMVASYAQGQGNSQAGLRDLALKAGKAATAGKFDEVKKLAAAFKPGAASPGAKNGPIAIHEQFELAELMQQFKNERGGGIALEGAVTATAKKRSPLTAKEIENANINALRIAVIAQPTEAYAPATDEGKKTKAQWVKWSKEMGELAVEAAKLTKATKPDDKAIKAAFRKLEDNCTACHAVFRDAS